MDQVIADAEIPRSTATGKGNKPSIRRPDSNPDHHVRIFFKCDLPPLAAVERQYPNIAVPPAVGEVGHFTVGGVQSGGLHLSGLVGDTDCPAHILGRTAVYRKLPDVELHMLPANQNASFAIYVRTFIAGFTKSELPWFASGF